MTNRFFFDSVQDHNQILSFVRADETSTILPDVGTLDDAFTFEAWVKPVATGATFAADILTQRSGANDACGLICIVRDNNTCDFGFSIDNGANTFNLTSANYPVDRFYHLVFTYDSSNAIVYINGVQAFSQAVTGDNTTTAPLYLGGNNVGGNYYFNGEIGAYSVRNNVVLTAPQVLAEYELRDAVYDRNLIVGLQSWSAFSSATITESGGIYTLTDGNAFSGIKYTIPAIDQPLNGQEYTFSVSARQGTSNQITLRVIEEGDSDGDASNFETIASQTIALTSEFETYSMTYTHNFSTECRVEIKAGTHALGSEGTIELQNDPKLL